MSSPDTAFARDAVRAGTRSTRCTSICRSRGAARYDERGAGMPAQTRLPPVDWSALMPAGPICLIETRKRDGNVNVAELAILATPHAGVPPGARSSRSARSTAARRSTSRSMRPPTFR